MKYNYKKFPLLLVLQLLITFEIYSQDVRIKNLTCEYRKNPLGIVNTQPSLSWQLVSNMNGQKQTAYRILVASSPELLNEKEADLWDSKKINSDQSLHIIYKGKPLQSRQQCYWKVKVWDKDGKETRYSSPARWEMSLLEQSDWKAKWIRHPDFLDNELKPKPAPFFRTTFDVEKSIRNARAYVTGLGYYEFYLNGSKIGDHVLDPVKTRYDKTVKYVIYDITSQLNSGKNAVGMILGTGWYNHFAEAAWGFDEAPWRAYPTMICQVELEYTDGTKETIISDENWKASQGPILFDGIRNGETYDARKEMPGWADVNFEDKKWVSVEEVEGPKGELEVQQLPAIKETMEITPVSIKEVKPGVYVFDLGQNIAGYSRIKVAGPRGTEIKLKHGERLHPDGTVEQKQILRFLKTGKAQTDHYILKGEGIEEWKPKFVYHGYQYVEVSGLPFKPSKETLKGIVINTSFESAGDFLCSNPLFNRIQELTRWSYIGNYHGMPTDCPHREKIGWTGDGHLVAEAGLFNYHTVTSYIKWLDDYVDEQKPDGNLPGVIPTSGWGYEYGKDEKIRHLGYGPSWEGAFILIPWYLYMHTGDTTILSRYYDANKKYIEHLKRNADNNLLNFGIDDHKAYYTKTEGDIIASGYYYYLTDLLSEIAGILGENADKDSYSKLADQIKKSFQKEYMDIKEGIVGHAGQTPLSQGIYMNLLPERSSSKVLDNLLEKIDSANYHFDVGVVGLKYLYESLTATGNSEILYQMVNKTDFPSYGYWIEQGANTLWQDWDGSMSLNHVMFGSVSEWFFEALAGINTDINQPGFKNVVFKPNFIKDLSWVSAEHESLYGKIRSSWERKDNKLLLHVELPPNVTGEIHVPKSEPGAIKINGNTAEQIQSDENDISILRVDSGKYSIEWVE